MERQYSEVMHAHLEVTKNQVKKAFLDCDAELKLDRSMDTTTSGSTAVFALIHNRQMTIAHVGDSRFIVGSVDRYGTVTTKCLTNDHNPDDPGERQRILKSDGMIQPLLGPTGQFEGPERIWLPDRPVQVSRNLATTLVGGDCCTTTVGTIVCLRELLALANPPSCDSPFVFRVLR